MPVLFALGSNGSGQLGIGHCDDVSVPTKSNLPEEDSTIFRIEAGGNHTLVLFASGMMYSVGANLDGRNLRNMTMSHPFNSLTAFRMVNTTVDSIRDARYAACAATWEASFAVLEDGRVVVAGTGMRGELASGPDVTQVTTPQLLGNFPPPGQKVVDIAAGVNHVIALLSNGDIYGWGSGRKGQIGQPAENTWLPRLIDDIPFTVSRVACGRDFTVFVGDEIKGEILVIGSEKWGVKKDAPASAPNCKDVGASWGSIFILLKSGKIVSWGRNDHKQLCPVSLPEISKMAVGSEHVICLAQNGDVITWGWGEHGNCGVTTDANNDGGATNLQLPGNAKAVAVGAGCATSFIVAS